LRRRPAPAPRELAARELLRLALALAVVIHVRQAHRAGKRVPGAPALRVWDAREGLPPRLLASDHVACPHFHVRCMPLTTCLERQEARWPGRNKLGDGTLRDKRAAVYDYCRSGLCPEGNAYRRATPRGWEPTLAANPGRMFYRTDAHDQHVARRAWYLSRTGPDLCEPPDIDHPPGWGEPHSVRRAEEDFVRLDDLVATNVRGTETPPDPDEPDADGILGG